jgi:hypothetical protein
MSRNGKLQRDEGGGTALTRIQVNEMIWPENFFWNKDNYCDSPHLRGKIDGFLRDGNRAILNRNTNGSRCDICVQTVGSAKSAGPGWPAAPLRRLTQTIFFPGSGLTGTYPHLDKTPDLKDLFQCILPKQRQFHHSLCSLECHISASAPHSCSRSCLDNTMAEVTSWDIYRQ